MLGTFSFEPYFKSYLCFTFRSLEISEIAKQPVFPFPCLPTCLLTAAVQSTARQPWRAASPCHLLHASFHASRLSLPPPSFPRAGASPAVPRAPPSPEPPRGRHLAVAVARPRQRPPPSPSARTGTTNTPAFHSALPFACSLLPRHRTRRRSTQNAGELKPPSSPHLRTSLPSIDPVNRSASSPHSSRATLSRPELTGAPSPS